MITDHIESVVQLEILLLLHARPQQESSADEVARELRIDPTWAAEQLDNLCGRGLLSCSDAASKAYRSAPRDPALALATDHLAKAYADRRVTIISLIFSKPVDKIRIFTDAFRIRKDRSDG